MDGTVRGGGTQPTPVPTLDPHYSHVGWIGTKRESGKKVDGNSHPRPRITGLKRFLISESPVYPWYTSQFGFTRV